MPTKLVLIKSLGVFEAIIMLGASFRLSRSCESDFYCGGLEDCRCTSKCTYAGSLIYASLLFFTREFYKGLEAWRL